MKNLRTLENVNDLPLYLFHQGTNYNTYDFLGAHFVNDDGVKKVVFRTWAPNADAVSVVGDFNGWDERKNPMTRISEQGVWETKIEGLKEYDAYKFAIRRNGNLVLKADPYAFHSETPSGTASKLYELDGYKWKDGKYMSSRTTTYDKPMNVYEVHLGSWKRHEDGSYYTYLELADELVKYVVEMGYTHVEFMPIAEYPFDGSWGYQVTGYYSISSRYGTPKDFMKLVDAFHRHNIGVILDWVPAHFPKDLHGLYEFDGTPCYENQGWDRKEHKEWGTRIFDWGRNEVQSFLISNAIFLFDKYHIDGLRVDAVASMLYLDYNKKDGEWIRNVNGGNYNLEAIAFLQKLNVVVFSRFPYALMIAEESTAFPMVTKPTDVGGLGFNFKWNMGWMNDTLDYMSMDSVYRKWHHEKLTFSLCYAFSENFVLPFSHDEVVHGKRSLIGRMPGDYWQQFAQLRLLFGYQYGHPGKKLMFMGCEFGQFIEWNFGQSLDWLLLDYPKHREMQEYVRALNHFYKKNPPMYECDTGWDGFEWMQVDDRDQSILIFMRRDKQGNEILCAYNFTPVPHGDYRIGCDRAVALKELLNSDDPKFGGTGDWMNGYKRSRKEPWNAHEHTISLKLPPYGAVFLAVKDAPKRTSNKTKSKK